MAEFRCLRRPKKPVSSLKVKERSSFCSFTLGSNFLVAPVSYRALYVLSSGELEVIALGMGCFFGD